MSKNEIGTYAGDVWQALHVNGAMSFDDLVSVTGLNQEAAYSALGWLAREDKLDFQEQNGVVSLYVYQERYYLMVQRSMFNVQRSKFIVVLLLLSCGDVFQTHPYDVDIDGPHHLNETNSERIETAFADKDTLRVAFISDTHLWHSDARDEVADINRRQDIDFVIHCGDLTDTGTTLEYKWARDILSGLRVPYVALIGNHDFLGTGDQAFRYMFGEVDFSLIAARVKFVCLNTNATEYDYMAAVPNFDFMEDATTHDASRFSRTVIVMHAPPYSDQFNNNVSKAFRRYLDFFPGLMCCLYGHFHGDDVEAIYGDDLIFYGVDCALHRNYRIMTITPDGYEMEQVFF